MRVGTSVVAGALALLMLSCSSEDDPAITREIATKVFCYDLLLATGAGGGAPSRADLHEPVVDAGDFRDDADLFRAAGENETAQRIDDLADELEAPADDLRLSIYLGADATEAEVEEVRTTIESWAGVRSVDFVSSEEAFQELSEEFADQPEVTRDLPKDALPRSFRVTFSAMRDLDAAEAAARELEAVDDVRPALSPASATITEAAAEFQELCRFGS